jgi:hypothetical protein
MRRDLATLIKSFFVEAHMEFWEWASYHTRVRYDRAVTRGTVWLAAERSRREAA